MFKPELYAKGSLTHEQLSVKESIGCDGLEVQLLSELIQDRVNGLYHKATDVFNLEDLSIHNIKVVHAPLIPGQGDVTLEVLVDNKDIALLTQIFKIADYFGKIYNRNTIIVLHSESYYDAMVDIGGTWSRITMCLRNLLNTYKNVEVAIENVSPFRGIGKGKNLHLANNFGFDNIEIVEHLREELGTDKIGTCLDTCHAMLTNKYITGVYKAVGDVPIEDFSLERYFYENADYIKLIHLSNIHGSGYGKGRHGVPFNDSTKDVLNSVLTLYHNYRYKCPITLEVEEDDYAVCNGYRKTKELIDEWYAVQV